MDIQRFVNRNNPQEKIFHSNAYARVAHGGKMGSTDSQSFSQRLDVHRNRQEVGHYGASMIGRSYLGEATRSQVSPLRQPGREMTTRQRFASRGGVPKRNALPPQGRFREPPSRGYNPYG